MQAEHYEWEDVILDEASQDEWEGMKKSLYFGLGCGVVGFGMLRWRRRRGQNIIGSGGFSDGLSKYASSSSKPKSSSGGYTFDPIPPPPKPNTNALQQNMQQQSYSSAYYQQQGYNNTHHGSSTGSSKTGLIIDVALSTILGLGASILALQTDIFYPTTLTISISNNGDDNIDETATTTTTTMDGSKTSITIGEMPPPPQWISSDIPLVPGRSMISETLCKPLTNEFRKFPRQLWQSGNNKGIENGYNNHMALYANSGWKGTKYYNGNENASLEMLGENVGGSSNDIGVSGGEGGEQQRGISQRGVYEHLVLDSLQGFIINCERRARQERKIRKIRGMMRYNSNDDDDDATPVVIPHDGVSADEDLTLDDIYLIEDGDE